MLKRILSKFFGTGAPTQAPARAGMDAEPSPNLGEFLEREAIVDRRQGMVAYGFAIRIPQARGDWQASSRRFFDASLLQRLQRLDIGAHRERRLAFCDLETESLDLPELDRLPGVVPCLGGDGAGMEPGPTLLARLEALKARGTRFCVGAESALAPWADYIRLPAGRLNPADLLAQTREARRNHPDKPLVAWNVDSVELFDACHGLGHDLFHGRHLTQRGVNRPPNLNSQRLVVSQLIGRLRHKEVDFDQLALIARQDLALTLRLLRYINSAAMGLRHKIGTLEQAMTYIGRDGLYRWLTLLLFYDSRAGQVDTALRETSLARGRFCELLARRRLSKAECEQAFVTGMLSLVDVLFSMPMAEALAQLGLPSDIHDALATGGGKYGPYISLTLACERADAETMEVGAARLGLSREAVAETHLEALAWAVNYESALAE
jgi:EAL and modified HD-GYP domain-containing signal transduction protein